MENKIDASTHKNTELDKVNFKIAYIQLVQKSIEDTALSLSLSLSLSFLCFSKIVYNKCLPTAYQHFNPQYSRVFQIDTTSSGKRLPSTCIYIYMVTFMRSHARRGIDQSRAVRETHLIPLHITVVFCISNYRDNDKACPSRGNQCKLRISIKPKLL